MEYEEVEVTPDGKDLLNLLFDKYKFSSKSLSKITGVPEDTITKYAKGIIDDSSIPRELYYRITLLTLSMEAEDEDGRVRGVITSLMAYYDISVETLAAYANVEPSEITSFLDDYNSIPLETRYKIGVTVLFLHFLCK
ncbi:HTH domain-containing protein [Lysinibacillus sp. 3P01SB]|uniref:HTH domain-containing protein n=1 Tax=Lysinibacillus sp. 3P01SB TaxID=3132284 RepID=UPI0039A6380A